MDAERPQVEPGQWLDASNKDITYVGCDVCEWETRGPYDEVRGQWIAHAHDPIFDIRFRLERFARSSAAIPSYYYLADVAYLLSLQTPQLGRSL